MRVLEFVYMGDSVKIVQPKVEVVSVSAPVKKYWIGDDYDQGSLDSESVIGEASRASYQSEADSDRTDRLIKHFLRGNHTESPLEFAWAAVSITGISYAAHVHFLRHRVMSQSWLSQRYTEAPDKVGFVLPASVGAVTKQEMSDAYDAAERIFSEQRRMGVKKQDARYVLPQGVAMQGYMAGNARAWVELLRLRRDKKAMPETRKVANLIAKELAQFWPTIAATEGWTE